MIDYEHVLFGTEEGLYAANLPKDEFIKITDKRVSEIRLIQELDLIFIIFDPIFIIFDLIFIIFDLIAYGHAVSNHTPAKKGGET